ncbi:hypothetical protein ZIOFF_074894 [Zingiber officinale]|uniref:CID domain-containing protein n=1 Tax=Zingiber officinale TaxID=94328 RepID=A0A8J5CQQ1_ZINOF|nr:hypothetical protein ZIOFF_074894 [Zingiber officinale]
MNSIFNETILADKLSKLNNTQQCIESILPAFSLSHWCIFHRKNAEQVIQTWDKQFHCSKTEQKGPFLYLANDILQNSKRTGTEFVSEFWKVLPVNDLHDSLNFMKFSKEHLDVQSLVTIFYLKRCMLPTSALIKRIAKRQLAQSTRNGPSAIARKKTAEVADKLAASTHSQQIMTSVLSTFAAEATNNVDPATSTNLPNSHSAVAPDRRMITENPMPISDTSTTSLIPFQPIVVSTPHQQAVLMLLAPQTQYMYPVPMQPYLQPTGGLMIGLPQSYNTIPPPQMINLARPSALLQQQQQLAHGNDTTTDASPAGTTGHVSAYAHKPTTTSIHLSTTSALEL